MHRIKLDEVGRAFCSCYIVQVHDFKLFGLIKSHPEGQTADPATSAASRTRERCRGGGDFPLLRRVMVTNE
jgi:hypothetical protein